MTRTVERPSHRALERSLEAALGEPGGVALRSREANSYASTFPSDVVTDPLAYAEAAAQVAALTGIGIRIGGGD